MIGIPYAYCDIDSDGTLVRVCPVCGARIRETTDGVGEQETNNYGRHYAAEHEVTA